MSATQHDGLVAADIELERYGEFLLSGEITQESAVKLSQALLRFAHTQREEARKLPVVLTLFSVGGNLDAGFHLLFTSVHPLSNLDLVKLIQKQRNSNEKEHVLLICRGPQIGSDDPSQWQLFIGVQVTNIEGENKAMTRDIRWRIISLQIVMIVVFAFGAGLAFYAGNFTHDQIRAQLEPQQIMFPPVGKGLPENLNQYAGQQVLNGEQAHAYADKFIGLHLSEMGTPPGKPYSYWSTVARTETDPVKKAAAADLVTTLFRGETLRSMLNQAWAFGTVGDIAIYAALGLLVATLIVAGALVFELFFAPKAADQRIRTGSVATSVG